jgi:hypothetical protein
VEVGSIFEISLLSRAFVDLQSAEVVFGEILSVRGSELIFGRRSDSLSVLAVNSSSRSLSEALCEDVLRLNLGDVARVPRDVLGLNVVSRTSEPVVSVLGVVAELQSFVEFISSGCVGVELSLGERRFAYSDINIVVAGLVASLGDDLINVSSSAAVNVVLLGHVTGVAR